jgi:hypothetical protein
VNRKRLGVEDVDTENRFECVCELGAFASVGLIESVVRKGEPRKGEPAEKQRENLSKSESTRSLSESTRKKIMRRIWAFSTALGQAKHL